MKSILIFWLIMFIAKISFSQYSDSTLIVKLLEKESSTWRTGDSIGHATCWKIEPYSTVIIMTADGKTFSIPPGKLANASKQNMGKGGSSKNSNYRMSFHGNTALVTHDEVSTSKAGIINHTFEVRMLEKRKGEWKLTGQIIQVID